MTGFHLKKKRRIKSKVRYFFYSVAFCTLMVTLMDVFACKPMGYDSSLYMRWSFSIIMFSISFAVVTMQYRRLYMVFVNTLLAFELMYYVAYYSDNRMVVFVIVVLFLVLLILFFYLMLRSNKHLLQVYGEFEWLGRVWTKFKQKIYPIAVVYFLICVVISFTLYEHSHYKPETEPTSVVVQYEEYQKQFFNDHQDQLLLLKEDNFAKLTAEQRMELAQFIVDYEVGALGLPEPVAIEAYRMENKDKMAHYDDERRTIVISTWHLKHDPVEEFVTSIAHEIRHAEQYDLCRAYSSIPEKYRSITYLGIIGDFKKELNSYVSGETNLDAYGSQVVEIDAEQYAENEVKKWMDYIHKAKGSTKGSDPGR